MVLSAVMVATLASTAFASGGEENLGETVSITTLDELRKFRDKVNDGATDLNASLMNDIDMSEERNWTPIGFYNLPNEDRRYNGKFNGNGHTIANFRIANEMYTPTQKGFFGAISEGAEISNLNVYGAKVLCSAQQVGVLVGSVMNLVAPVNRSNINRCKVSDSEVYNKAVVDNSAAGAITGSADYCDFYRCTSQNNKVKGNKEAGSHIGCGKDCKATLCLTFNGSVESILGNSAGIAGKLLGHNQLDYCFNSAQIKAGFDGAGIASDIGRGSNITNSWNEADLIFRNETECIAGISANCGANIINCYNTGDFDGGVNDNNTTTIVGGIVAKIWPQFEIKNTHNTGKTGNGHNRRAILGIGSTQGVRDSYYLNNSSQNGGGGILKTQAEFTAPETNNNGVLRLLNIGRAGDPSLAKWTINTEISEYPILDVMG